MLKKIFVVLVVVIGFSVSAFSQKKELLSNGCWLETNSAGTQRVYYANGERIGNISGSRVELLQWHLS